MDAAPLTATPDDCACETPRKRATAAQGPAKAATGPANRLRQGDGGPPIAFAKATANPPKLQRRRKLNAKAEAGHYLAVFLFCAGLLAVPVGAIAQPEPSRDVAGETHAPAGDAHEGEEAHGRGAVDVIARLVNFAILAGTLVYLLRSPIGKYIEERRTQVRSDLVNAAEMKETAAAQIEEITRKMNAQPRELEALRAQGAEEIVSEEQRIRAGAVAERDRLLEQARREIDLQVKTAERELVSHAAELTVGIAAERIKKNINDEDQKRLVDRYVQQLKGSA